MNLHSLFLSGLAAVALAVPASACDHLASVGIPTCAACAAGVQSYTQTTVVRQAAIPVATYQVQTQAVAAEPTPPPIVDPTPTPVPVPTPAPAPVPVVPVNPCNPCVSTSYSAGYSSYGYSAGVAGLPAVGYSAGFVGLPAVGYSTGFFGLGNHYRQSFGIGHGFRFGGGHGAHFNLNIGRFNAHAGIGRSY